MQMSPPIPILRIFDLEKARTFYLDYLGFAVDWEHRFGPDMPIYMQIRRGDCVLHLSEHSGDATPGSACRIAVADLPGLLAELQAKPYRYARPGIERMPWGLDELAIKDTFGNRIVFYAEASRTEGGSNGD